MSDPIIPSRIIPAGHPIPTAPPPGPPAPPGATNLPPWRTAAAPAPPSPPTAAPPPVPAPDPGPIEHRVTVEVVFPEPEAEDEPGRWARIWEAVTGYVKPWKAVVALAAAVVPMPWTGYSTATTWAFVMGEARDMHVAVGYGLAVGAFALVLRRFIAKQGVVALWGVAVTGIGIFGAADWFDAVTALTGVRR